jgi:hypothetical protein
VMCCENDCELWRTVQQIVACFKTYVSGRTEKSYKKPESE